MDRRVEEAIARFRHLPHAERAQVAAGVWEAIAVLTLMAPPLPDEVKMVGSVAHMPVERAFVVLQGVAEERGKEARDRLEDFVCHGFGCAPAEGHVWHNGFHRLFAPGCRVSECGRLCVLVNQGPCTCHVPAAVADLRRRQRALLWACETIMRPRCSFCGWAEQPNKGCCKAENRRAGIEPMRHILQDFARLCQIEALSKPNDDADDWTHQDRVHLRETAAIVKERFMSIGPK